MQELYAEMQQLEVKPDVWTFSALMVACQTCGNHWQDALKFLELMEGAGTLVTFELLAWPGLPTSVSCETATLPGRAYNLACRYLSSDVNRFYLALCKTDSM